MSDGVQVNTHQNFHPQIRVTSETTQAKFGLAWEEIAILLERHTLSVQSWLSSRSPQGKRFEGVGVTATSTGLKMSFINLALSSHFPADTSDAVIEQEIKAVQNFFNEREVPYYWLLSPLAAPADMSERLRQHQLRPREYRLPALAAPLTTSEGWPVIKPNIEIWQARDLSDLAAASTIRRIATRTPEAAHTYFEDMAADWLRGDPARLYMAHLSSEGPPVAIGALIIGEHGWPGVYLMATLPEWEGNGLGKAILNHILSQAKSDGYDKIFLTAGDRAYSLYRKFGFEHIFEFEMFEPVG